MSLINLLASKRHSIRQYRRAPIAPDTLTDIMESALKAPTSRNSRGVRFVLVEEPATLEALSRARVHGGRFVQDAPLVVVVCADTQVSARPESDAAIAATYLQLAVTDNDLGSCWSHVADSPSPDGRTAEEVVREVLSLPDHFMILCMIAIGDPRDYTALEPRQRELEWEHVYIGKYEERSTHHVEEMEEAQTAHE